MPEADPLRDRGEVGECRPALEHVLPRRPHLRDLAEVIHHPQRVEAGPLGPSSDVAQPLTELARSARPGEAGELQSEAQARASRGDDRGRRGHRHRRRDERDTLLADQDVVGVERFEQHGLADARPLGELAAQHRVRHAVGARSVAPPHLRRRRVEDDGDARHPGVARRGQPPCPAGSVGAERVDDRRQSTPQSRRDDPVEHVERVTRRAEVVRALAHHGAQRVARHDVRREGVSRPTSICPIRPPRRARRGTATAAPPAHDDPSGTAGQVHYVAPPWVR